LHVSWFAGSGHLTRDRHQISAPPRHETLYSPQKTSSEPMPKVVADDKLARPGRILSAESVDDD
jgi:hypothetical protein